MYINEHVSTYEEIYEHINYVSKWTCINIRWSILTYKPFRYININKHKINWRRYKIIGHLDGGIPVTARTVMMVSGSKRKRGRRPAILKKKLTNDLRNIAMIADIDGTNVLDDIRKMDKYTYHRMTLGLWINYYYILFIHSSSEYILTLLTQSCQYQVFRCSIRFVGIAWWSNAEKGNLKLKETFTIVLLCFYSSIFSKFFRDFVFKKLTKSNQQLLSLDLLKNCR